MTSTLVDTNVILDVVEENPTWAHWSENRIEKSAERGRLVIDTVIFAEISMSFVSFPALIAYVTSANLVREATPWEAAFEAGKAHARYRASGGLRERTLPDFFIGAHAAVKGYQLLTRDPRRYRQYFPTLDIIAPDTHP